MLLLSTLFLSIPQFSVKNLKNEVIKEVHDEASA